ncbi:unnamed protein product [Paramecium octaurelia]|uniref:Uncharacterized protein n=1 Tax=Paramecium octaurelia TaxID=43137 RepID=A0A8S1VGS2_PAROT|nr:unnamed protein product [Paramecium octaurelia]
MKTSTLFQLLLRLRCRNQHQNLIFSLKESQKNNLKFKTYLSFNQSSMLVLAQCKTQFERIHHFNGEF